jgi:predicted Fe-S protein YdhL (DUF1289 family)
MHDSSLHVRNRRTARDRRGPICWGVKKNCIDICKFDPDTGWCRGCGQTRTEKKGWKKLKKPVRKAIRRELPGRLAALGDRRIERA